VNEMGHVGNVASEFSLSVDTTIGRLPAKWEGTGTKNFIGVRCHM